jgi:hypothetical protein
MLSKYSGFVKAYVTLKQDAQNSGANSMQKLKNIQTLL